MTLHTTPYQPLGVYQCQQNLTWFEFKSIIVFWRTFTFWLNCLEPNMLEEPSYIDQRRPLSDLEAATMYKLKEKSLNMRTGFKWKELVRPYGLSSWSVQLVRPALSIQLVHPAGPSSWSVQLVCPAGPSRWSVQLGCPAGLFSRPAMLQSCNVAMLQCCNVAMLQCCNVTKLQSCKVAKLQCCNVAKLQWCNVAMGQSC